MADLEISRADGVLRLRLNRPDTLNALAGTMTVDLVREVRSASTDPEVRVVLITGTGAAFSAGADLTGERPHDKYDAESVDHANAMVTAVLDCARPVVCGLNGVAAGVGMSLALAADLVVATESAALTLGFTKIGLMPDGGASALVPASIGRATAMRLALLSDVMSAKEAFAAGLISWVFPDADYPGELEKILSRLAAGAPLALTATKRAVNAATLSGLPDAFGRERSGQSVLLRTDDVREGMAAFVEKRRPEFAGE